ncbi:ankyrin repeat domain-containing protein 9 [Onychostoma macrolepis]|uniref:ankyrin repeat domain-containing protein 9 n=1 Tax=Onychostoma macrolepis TaxID=369639 RepID=UPI00272CE799|nr:ankyrin repeat domain-containing protein 9 [Onychostoma macrolepis]
MDAERKQHALVSFLFYQAVRDLKPVWMLEDMRTMETFYWEEDATQRSYSPSEALLYAIVHDHRAYAQHLLSRFAHEALATPGARFCCRASSAPHLAMAVRYDRRDILALILQAAHREPRLRSYLRRGGCAHLEDGKTPLHLACELLRADAVMLLLGSGASPRAVDSSGMTPLDVVLQQLRDSKANAAAKKCCLEKLLLFMPQPRFAMRSSLLEEPRRWATLLGEDTLHYLIGREPAPLFLCAMRAILTQLPPEQFPASLDTLPIPAALKPLPRAHTLRGLDRFR